MRLLYIADPLCSWCYGFGPELAKLLERHPQAELGLMMGGLRPFNREKMSAAFKQMLREHWRHVHEASGLPFSEAILAREDFVYDTEPACRAVVTARTLDPGRAFPYLKSVQAAFYAQGRDATQPEVLAGVAERCGYDRDGFREALESEAMRAATRQDFAAAQSLGVSGFPTLGVAHGEQLYLVSSGFATEAVLESRLAQIAERARSGAS